MSSIFTDTTNNQYTISIVGTLTQSSYIGVSGTPSGTLSLITVKTVVLGTDVTQLGVGAFEGCTNMTSVTIPYSVTTLGDRAFQQSGLTSVTIPATVTAVGNGSFSGCKSLDTVNWATGSTITTIPPSMFTGTGLTEITFPDAVTTISSNAYQNIFGHTANTVTVTEPIVIPASVTTKGFLRFHV
jgi:hypothetical protein